MMSLLRSFAGLTAFCLLLLLLSCSPSTESSSTLKQLEPFGIDDRYVIAIMPFEFKGSQGEFRNAGDRLVDLAVVELFNTKRFRIVERSRIDTLLNEAKLSQMGITSSQMADKIGKQVGAEMVLLGTITSIRPIGKKDTAGIAWRETRGFEVNLQGRLINVTLGEVIAVGQATADEQQTMKVALGATTGSIAPEETLLDKALEKAIKILVNDFAGNVTPKTNS